MRVGDRTDFNRLRMVIETDGTITTKRALEAAIEVLLTQLRSIVGWREDEFAVSTAAPDAAPAAAVLPADESTDIMKTRIEDLDLSARTISALQGGNIRTVGGLARKKESDLFEIGGLGPKSVQEVKRALSNFGITLK